MENLLFRNNKFEGPIIIVICLILLQYWAPQLKNQKMIEGLGTMLGSTIMVGILVLFFVLFVFKGVY